MEKFRKVLKGDGVSLGIARANSYLYEPSELMTSPIPFEEGMEQKYLQQLEETLMAAKEELWGIYAQMMEEQQENSGIFMSHQAILEDESLIEEIQQEILKNHAYPDRAIRLVMDRHIDAFCQAEDTLLAERAGDLRDVQKRLIRIWQGKPDHNLRDIKEDVIIVAYDLLPSEIAGLSQEHVKGIVTEIGGETSHCAILARCYGIPAVLGVKHAMRRVGENTPLILDALAGEVLVWPTSEDEIRYQHKMERFLQQYESERQYLEQPAETKDGTEVQIGINLGTEEIAAEDSWYDYVGLLRSEFLYMNRGSVPTEEEETEAYKKVLLQAAGKMVTIRTLDLGGDKMIDGLEMVQEVNPALGLRGIRLCRKNPKLFEAHVRALLKASVYGKMRIMFPMVTGIDDIRWAKSMVRQVMKELDEGNIPYDKEIELGAVLETPAICEIADLVAEEVDFASIGTNDLVQYLCGVDRNHSGASSYYQTYNPAVLRVLSHTIEMFNRKGKFIGVCGEMAGQPLGAKLLVGLGARNLSMDVGNVAAVKASLSQTTLKDLVKQAQMCKNLRTEEEVKAFCGIDV